MNLDLSDLLGIEFDQKVKLKDLTDTQVIILYIIYTVLFLIYQPVFFILMKISIYKIRDELKDKNLDIFKITQYIFLIGFLVTRQLFFMLQYFKDFSYFYDFASFVIFSIFNTFEWINIACWFLFIIQMWRYRSVHEGSYSLKQVKIIEIVILVLISFISIILFGICIVIIVLCITMK